MISTQTTTTTTNHYFRALVALLAALAMVASLLLTQPQKPAQAAFPGQNGKIAFVSDRDGNFEIYAMNPDGTGQANLTNLSTADDFDPDWGVSAAVTASTAPTVTNLSPPPNSTTSDRTPTIKATVADKETNLQKSNIKFFLDGLRIQRLHRPPHFHAQHGAHGRHAHGEYRGYRRPRTKHVEELELHGHQVAQSSSQRTGAGHA
jgi:hypothetical protein